MTELDDPAATPRQPKALIFADSDAARAQAVASLTAIGGERTEALPLSSVRERLERQAGPRTILIDFAAARDRIEADIACVERFADATGSSAIAVSPIGLIDRLDAAVTSDTVQILCEPDLTDRVASLALALSGDGAVSHFADSAADPGSLRLKRLADEVNRIARALTSLSVNGDDGARYGGQAFAERGAVRDAQIGFAAEPAEMVMPPASEIRAILRMRRLRESFFDPELFADPAWDMLLDLLAARLEGDQVAVSSLCIAAAVPPTTALRWIKTMTDTNLLERHADPMDGRRIFIRLTENAANALGRYFAAARRQGGMLL